MSDRVRQHLRDALADRAEVFPYAAASDRLTRIDYKPRYDRRLSSRVLGAVSISGAAVIAAVVSVILAVGGSSPAAYGWTPKPKALTPAQLHAVARAVRLKARGSGCEGHGRSVVLADVRGPYTYTLYVTSNVLATVCLNGVEGASGAAGSGPVPATRTRNVLSTYGTINQHPWAVSPYRFLQTGQAGADVRSVTVLLSTGTKVQATLEHGWYLVWWPAKEGYSKQLIITTRTSTTARSKTYETPDNGELPGHCGAGPATNAVVIEARQELKRLQNQNLTPQQQRTVLKIWLRKHGYRVQGHKPHAPLIGFC